MKYLGIVYDVGLRFLPDALSVDPFDIALVEHDITAISRDLHANAIRIEGERIERLTAAARVAHAAGLTVFFNPWMMHASIDETRAYVSEAAEAAEQLRSEGVDIIFVVGCELTIFTDGIFPGSGFMERGMWLGAQLTGGESGKEALAERFPLLNDALRSLAGAARTHFGGRVTYSAGLWEEVDWAPFDLIGLDYYRHAETEADYVGGLDRHRLPGKPVVVMEVGCCKYEGAGVRGDGGFAVLTGTNPDGTGQFEGGIVPTRSEREQADYLATQLGLLAGADVEGVLVFEFSKPALPTGDGARDLDMANFSLVKTYPAGDARAEQMPPWAPTEGFQRVAEAFRDLSAAPAQITSDPIAR